MKISIFRTRIRLWRLCAVLGAALASVAPAQAQITPKDIQIAGRVLTFLTPAPTGTITIGIVFEPGNAGSAADERALATIIGSGLQIEGVNLIAVPVPMAKLSSAQVDVYFLTADLGADAKKVGARASAQNRLCITMDLTATQAGDCAVAVQSAPTVKITVNIDAAKESGLNFATAFLLMVTEI